MVDIRRLAPRPLYSGVLVAAAAERKRGGDPGDHRLGDLRPLGVLDRPASRVRELIARGGPSEPGDCVNPDDGVASRRRLEELPVGVADDHRTDVLLVEQVLDSQELADAPVARALLEHDPPVHHRIRIGPLGVGVARVDAVAVAQLERRAEALPDRAPARFAVEGAAWNAGTVVAGAHR